MIKTCIKRVFVMYDVFLGGVKFKKRVVYNTWFVFLEGSVLYKIKKAYIKATFGLSEEIEASLRVSCVLGLWKNVKVM